MSINSDLITRIRKILAKTEESGCTSAEAEAAYALASNLMAKYNLDMAQIEQAAGLDGDGWTEEIVHEAGRASSVHDMIAGICNRFFFVESVRSHGFRTNGKRVVSMLFFGSPTNVENARFIFTSLLEAVEKAWKCAFYSRQLERSDRLTFACGFIDGYHEKLSAERGALIQNQDVVNGAGGTEIMLQTINQKTEAAFKAAYPDCRTGRSKGFYGSYESYESGHQAGLELDLHRALGSPGSPKAITKGLKS
jgi:Protein of unknown function (DUF2786)